MGRRITPSDTWRRSRVGMLHLYSVNGCGAAGYINLLGPVVDTEYVRAHLNDACQRCAQIARLY